jgi:hypothetical protein
MSEEILYLVLNCAGEVRDFAGLIFFSSFFGCDILDGLGSI